MISSEIHEMSQVMKDVKGNSVFVGVIQMCQMALMYGFNLRRCLGGTLNRNILEECFHVEAFNDLWQQSTWLARQGLPWFLSQSWIALYWWCLYHFRKPLKMMYRACPCWKAVTWKLKGLFSRVAIAVYLSRELALVIISLKPFFKAIDTNHIVFFSCGIRGAFLWLGTYLYVWMWKEMNHDVIFCHKAEI